MPGGGWRRNCSGFLRITHSSEDANAEDLHTEDASRINPTQYELAKVSRLRITNLRRCLHPYTTRVEALVCQKK